MKDQFLGLYGPNSGLMTKVHNMEIYTFDYYWRNFVFIEEIRTNIERFSNKELSNSSWDIQFSEILPFLAKKG